MPIDSGNLALKGLDDLFSTEENRQEEQREQVQQIPIDALHPFTTRSSPGTAASMRLNLPGWKRCRSLCGRCRTMLL